MCVCVCVCVCVCACVCVWVICTTLCDVIYVPFSQLAPPTPAGHVQL